MEIVLPCGEGGGETPWFRAEHTRNPRARTMSCILYRVHVCPCPAALLWLREPYMESILARNLEAILYFDFIDDFFYSDFLMQECGVFAGADPPHKPNAALNHPHPPLAT